MSDTKTLYIYSYQSPNESKMWVKLEETVQKFKTALEGATAILYSPTKCYILKLANGQFQDAYGISLKNKDFRKIFEARIFNPSCEFRWLNVQSGYGKPVVLSENKISKPDHFEEKTMNYQEALEQQYLLWGEIVSKPRNFQKGWERLTEARIDKIDIPIDEELNKNKRVYLQSREYIAEMDYGNMVVFEERLVKLHSNQNKI
ncbi:MAG: TIGR03984 family CRISPR-associated protein [Kamptonema sp. SIO4C4]|nr:TIGR03984 family CRISPR-associated protein [Kamptonema sp. SIO4C4]